jgi:hypothetical protein
MADEPVSFDERCAEMAKDAERAIRVALSMGKVVTINFIPPVTAPRINMRSCMFIDDLFAGDARG